MFYRTFVIPYQNEPSGLWLPKEQINHTEQFSLPQERKRFVRRRSSSFWSSRMHLSVRNIEKKRSEFHRTCSENVRKIQFRNPLYRNLLFFFDFEQHRYEIQSMHLFLRLEAASSLPMVIKFVGSGFQSLPTQSKRRAAQAQSLRKKKS